MALIYGPQEQDKNSIEFYDMLENKLASMNNKGDIILVGDFNAKILDIENEFMSQKKTKNDCMLNEIINRQNLENLDSQATKPTFVSHDGKKVNY